MPSIRVTDEVHHHFQSRCDKVIEIIIIAIILRESNPMFINRIAELDLLEKHYHSGKAELFVLYGRQRVGKTELLAHFC